MCLCTLRNVLINIKSLPVVYIFHWHLALICCTCIGHLGSIESWTDAFVNFMIIYIQRHPNKAVELFKYMSIVREASVLNPFHSCYQYDVQFDCAWHITRQGHGQTLMVTCGWHAVCLVPQAVKDCHSLVFPVLPVPVSTTITKANAWNPYAGMRTCACVAKLHIQSVIVVRLAILWPRVQW